MDAAEGQNPLQIEHNDEQILMIMTEKQMKSSLLTEQRVLWLLYAKAEGN